MIKLKDIVIDILNEGIKLKDVKVKWLKDKPDLTDAQVDYYWDKINAYNNAKSGNDKINLLKTPFTGIEKIVDKSSDKGLSSADMNKDYKEYADENGLVVYNQNNMMIARGDSKVSCIMLGKGENWCINKTDSSNMYYAYKHGLGEPTIYYSYDFDKLEQNKDDVNGILIIMVNKDGTYTVADRNNKENRGGGKVDWSYISKLQPKLKSIKGVFKYVPISKEEKKKYEIIRSVAAMPSHEILYEYKKLDFEGQSLYIDMGYTLTSKMFWATDDELKEKYIKMGGQISYDDMMILSPKLKKELNYILHKKIESNDILDLYELKYLLGGKFENILLKYFDKRIGAGEELFEYEFKFLIESNFKDLIIKYLNKKIDNNINLKKDSIEYYEFKYLIDNKDDNKINYINTQLINYLKNKKNKTNLENYYLFNIED